MIKAKESAYILKLRKKLTKRFDENSKLDRPEALAAVRNALRSQLEKHAIDRPPTKRQVSYTFDKNQHPASIQSKYIKDLLGQLGKNGAIRTLDASSNTQAAKKAAAHAAAKLITNGMTVGLGTGTTSHFFIEELGILCQQGLKITAVATSIQSADLAKQHNIPLIDINTLDHLDITIDGADEIDLKLQMIKGGGGALYREKIVASMSKTMIAIVDHTKVVKRLGKFPLAVEILPFGYKATLLALADAGYKGTLRLKGNHPYITDNHNYVVDIQLPFPIPLLSKINRELKEIVGVVETGLFLNIARKAIIGFPDGHTEEISKK